MTMGALDVAGLSWTSWDMIQNVRRADQAHSGSYGRHTDRTRLSRGEEWRIRRSAGIPMGRDGLPVKPSASPSMVRIHHLPPGKTPAQGRFGVPDSLPAHAARCHRKRPDAAGRGIYVGWLPICLPWSRGMYGLVRRRGARRRGAGAAPDAPIGAWRRAGPARPGAWHAAVGGWLMALPQISRAHSGQAAGTARCRLPRRTIVPLPATASRSLPAVASHAIGYAEPRHGVHSQGFGACRGIRGRAGARQVGYHPRIWRWCR